MPTMTTSLEKFIVRIVAIVPFVRRPSAREIRSSPYFTTIVPRMPAAKWPGNVQT